MEAVVPVVVPFVAVLPGTEPLLPERCPCQPWVFVALVVPLGVTPLEVVPFVVLPVGAVPFQLPWRPCQPWVVPVAGVPVEVVPVTGVPLGVVPYCPGLVFREP